jgi:DNA-directed RNA polymerase alpha subunit
MRFLVEQDDQFYGMDKAVKSKLLNAGISNVEAVRTAIENGNLCRPGIKLITQRHIERWLELVDLIKSGSSDPSNIDFVLFGLSTRTRGCLRADGLCTVDAVFVAYRDKKLRMPNLGRASIDEIRAWLCLYGYEM